ncbi:TonB-dependent receptor [Luteimonas panaciterrae]|uniref:TonB-dependent receptor n=1 Tax=Luteimonas panaciterrae TaxID=363885 RepID=UPI001CF9CB3B|nr:TonB-dependent siderophore receptor [Luteimonas panaciterrae]
MNISALAVAPLAAALATALASPASASDALPATTVAATGSATSAEAEQKEATQLDTIEVEGRQVRKVASPKYTEPLLDTPQSVTVVTKQAMDQQGLLSLRDVLSTLPGITFGAGEGGGGYGDSITLRGFNASSDITTDNVRDSAQYSRTDTFNIEAVELINGANSVYSGAGSVGGNINLVSKSARGGDFTLLQGGAGTDGYGRITVDSNTDFDNGTAFRINAMVHQNDAPGRDFEDFERWGIAPSIAFGLGSDTRFTLSYLHQHDENVPQYGVPYFSAFGGPLPGVDPENYYGYRNLDKQEIDVDMLTGVFEHDFGENTTLRSLARFQKVDQLTVVDAPQGTWCLENGINPATGATCTSPNTYRPSGPRGHSRDTSNAIAISQTDLTTRFNTGAVEHALVAGVSFSHESFDLDTVNLTRNPDGSPVTLPPMSLTDPDGRYTGPINPTLTGRTEGTLDNQAFYLFDTLKFGEHWMLNLGARYEHNEGDSAIWNIKTYTAPTSTNPNPDNSNIGAVLGRGTPARNEDDLFSYRAGLVYKPTANGTIYLSYSNSKTPSKASVNGSCTLTSATGTANCNVNPETAVNIELGTKWELSEGLALTAAIFRNERQNYKVADPGNPDNPLGEQQLDGEARVDGITLGLAGRITEAWEVYADVAWLDSEVLQGISDYSKRTGVVDLLKGRSISGTPERSGSVWTTYDLNAWTFGYGITYQSGYEWYNASGANGGDVRGYTTHRAMVAYEVNDRLSLQLNANNLFDKEYYLRVRNNGWATPGDGRQVVLSASYRF